MFQWKAGVLRQLVGTRYNLRELGVPCCVAAKGGGNYRELEGSSDDYSDT